MKEKIKGKVGEFEMDVKRFYVPGVKIEGKCPACKGKVVNDLGQNYIGYPLVNQDFYETMYCSECNEEWKVIIRLNVTLELVEAGPEKAAE